MTTDTSGVTGSSASGRDSESGLASGHATGHSTRAAAAVPAAAGQGRGVGRRGVASESAAETVAAAAGGRGGRGRGAATQSEAAATAAGGTGAAGGEEGMEGMQTPVAGEGEGSEMPRGSGAQAKAGSHFPPPEHSFLSRRPRVLLAASGSVAAIKFPIIVHSVSEWADVKAVCTKSALHFVDPPSLPAGVPVLTDEDEWRGWNRLGDPVLHIELRNWADVLVIAPLSANTLAKVANGVCDNLLTCVVRAWDFRKPLLVAPAMNTHMWNSTFTTQHLQVLKDLGVLLSSPISKTLACGDVGTGAMAEPGAIEGAIRRAVSSLDTRN